MIEELKRKLITTEILAEKPDNLRFLVVCSFHISSKAKSYIFVFKENQNLPIFLVKIARTQNSYVSLKNAHNCLEHLKKLRFPWKRFFPEPIYCGEVNGYLTQVETYERGEILAKRLIRWQGQADFLSLLKWLEDFHIFTSKPLVLSERLLEEKIIFYVNRVSQIIKGDHFLEDYLKRLDKNFKKLIGQELRFVFAHNNLSLFNLKIDKGDVKVLDWEESQPDGLPLLDFYHLLYSYYKLRYREDSVQAYRRLFQGRIDSKMKEQLEHYCQKLNIPAALQTVLIQLFLLLKITQVESYRDELLVALKNLAQET